MSAITHVSTGNSTMVTTNIDYDILADAISKKQNLIENLQLTHPTL